MAKKHSKICKHSLERLLFKSGKEMKEFVCKLCQKRFREVKRVS